MKQRIIVGLSLLISCQVGLLTGEVCSSLCFKCMKYNFHCDCRKLEREQAHKAHNEYIAKQNLRMMESRAEYYKIMTELTQRSDTETKEPKQRSIDAFAEYYENNAEHYKNKAEYYKNMIERKQCSDTETTTTLRD